jgi:nucleoside-diphosphate-sugar epimerase
MTEVLVLGGTGWLSGRIARRWLESGAAVTCLARGGRPAPAGAQLVTADRDERDAYAAVEARQWDEVVDVSSNPAHVAGALEALADSAAHWTYVSSLSVYARADVENQDESAETLSPTRPGDESDYGRDKAAAEASVRAAAGDHAAVLRPGLIVGPGDPTDRFGYWVARFALAGGDPVLVPETAGRSAQVIDVDDVAAFAVDAAAASWAGTANAIGDVHPLSDVLMLAREVAGHTGAVVAASDEALTANDVAHWAGPRSLPLWLPGDMPGFMTHRNDVFRAAGGSLRPLRDTLERTLADERARGLDRDRRAGLARADELDVIAALGR